MHKVLIINGNLSSTEKIASALTKSGFEVTNVATEREGLKLVDELSPDAIVVKDDSTQLDGLNLCQQIRHLVILPLILLGTRQEAEVYSQSLETEADWDYYMCLPINYEELAARIKVLLWRYGKGERPNITEVIEF